MPMWFWDGVPGMFGLFFLLFVVTFTVALIVGIVLLVRALANSGAGRGTGGSRDALRILEERYARGEIERDEFIQRRDDLRG
jgi:putative membrane protein